MIVSKERRHFQCCSCDAAFSEKANTEATDPSGAHGGCCTSTWWEWRPEGCWLECSGGGSSRRSSNAVWSSQSLLILTHDSVCFVPCLADGPEISTDQEGAVPPYPSSASAFPLPGLSLSARHHHPFILFPHSDDFLAFPWIQQPACIVETCWLCLWKRLFLRLIQLAGQQESAVSALMLRSLAYSEFSCCWFCDQIDWTCFKWPM